MLLKSPAPLALVGCAAVAVALAARDLPSPPADGPQTAVTWTFDDSDAIPAGFTFAAMRRPEPMPFVIRSEGPARFLHHAADPEGRGYSMAIAPGEAMTDLAVSVKIRLDGGDRVAGIVSRYSDAMHFYVTLLDLGQAELTMWRVFNGNRDRIEASGDHQLDPASWHELKVVHHDERVRAYLNGVRVFEDRDGRNRAFAPGRSGVMVFADTAASFDDLRIDRVRAPHDRP